MPPKHSKPKVLVIFPRLSESESSHYPYWYKLFDEAANDLDIAIIFESGSRTVKPKNLDNISQWVIQSQQQKPWNLINRFQLIRQFVNKGYSNIYIHYSYWSVIISWLVKLITPKTSQVKIYYWNCEKYEVKPKDVMLDLSLKLCDILVTGHQVIADSYRQTFKLGNKPIKIVPNWVEEIVGNQKLATAKKVGERKINILFVHHLSPRKGSRELPVIIQETIKQIPNAHFHLIGDGPDRLWLESQLKSPNLVNHVTFYGNLPLNQVQQFFHTCDIFIMPSRSEGFPRVILEAMKNKIPFVSTDVGCVKQIVAPEQSPFIVKTNNTEQFVEKMITFHQLNQVDKVKITEENHKLCKKKYGKSQAMGSFISVFK